MLTKCSTKETMGFHSGVVRVPALAVTHGSHDSHALRLSGHLCAVLGHVPVQRSAGQHLCSQPPECRTRHWHPLWLALRRGCHRFSVVHRVEVRCGRSLSSRLPCALNETTRADPLPNQQPSMGLLHLTTPPRIRSSIRWRHCNSFEMRE